MKLIFLIFFFITLYEFIMLMLGEKVLAGKMYIYPTSINKIILFILLIILIYVITSKTTNNKA